MDKAQARILTLVLIAVLFIGQALYDFIKKNRSRSVNRPRQTIRKPNHKVHPQKRQFSPKPIQTAVSPKAHVTADRSKLEAELYPSVQSGHEMVSADEITEPGNETSPQQTNRLPEGDELRRAVIWSEILKRKF